MGKYNVQEPIIKNLEDMYNERLSRVFNGDDNDENDIGMCILYNLYTYCIKYLKEDDIPRPVSDVKITVLIHFKMIDMINSYESDNKDIFECISNEIFIELVNV